MPNTVKNHSLSTRILKTNLLKLCCFGIILPIPFFVFAQRPGNELEPSQSKTDTSSQRDLIDIGKKFFNIDRPKEPDSVGKKYYFSFLPFSTHVPGGGAAMITTTSAGFYQGDRKTTNMSRLNFTPYWNFGKRFGLPIRSYVWFENNTWVIMGDTRFMRYPQYTWGLGNHHGEDHKKLVNYNYFRFYQHALHRLGKSFYAGVGYNLDYRMNINLDDGYDLSAYSDYEHGTSGNSVSSGFSINMLYDTRNNSINPLDGAYAYIQYRVNPTFLGSDDLWHSVYFDARKYFRFTEDINRQNMLGVWMYYWGVLDSHVPYLDLPSIGWDVYNRSGRGFDQNRYRGKHLVYLESEYRRDITSNGLLGFVVFANTNTVSGPNSKLLLNWHMAAGAGLRIKFNKGAGTNIAIDFGKSKDFSGFQIGLDEVF